LLCEGLYPIGHGNGIDAHCGGRGESLFCETVDLRRLRTNTHGGRRLGYKTASAPNQRDGTHSLELVVSVPDRIEVNLQSNCYFPHRRHLVARSQRACAKIPQDLLSKLDVDRNARIIQMKRFE